MRLQRAYIYKYLAVMWSFQKDIYKYKKKVLEQMAFFYSTEPNDMEAC